jgi:hypothetical protein
MAKEIKENILREKNPETLDLIQRVKSNEGWEESIQVLSLKYRKILIKILSPGMDLEEVNDLISEVWVDFRNIIIKFDPSKSSFSTWISKIAFNKKLNYIKKRKKKIPLSDTLLLKEIGIDKFKIHDPAIIMESIEVIQEKMNKTTQFIFLKYRPMHHIFAFIIRKFLPASKEEKYFKTSFGIISQDFFKEFSYLDSTETEFNNRIQFTVGDSRNWPPNDDPRNRENHFGHLLNKIILNTFLNEYLLKFENRLLVINTWINRLKKRAVKFLIERHSKTSG